MRRLFTVLALVAGVPLIAASALAQSTTNTNCNVNEQQVNCTSTTAAQPQPSSGWVDGLNKAAAANRERADANLAVRAQEAQQAKSDAESKEAQENRTTVNIVYCRQNAKGSVTTSDGQIRSCPDELAYASAECAVNPATDFCKLFISQAEMEKAFAKLADGYRNDHPNRHSNQMYYDSLFQTLRKWACLSYPESKWPVRDGSYQPCPNATDAATVLSQIEH